MSTLGVLWAQYGPYHLARVGALQRLHEAGRVYALEIGSRTSDYAWNRATVGLQLHTLCENSVAERVSFSRVFFQARRKLSALRIDVCFLPSYYPKQSLAALLAAKSLGIKTVMMNETHAGTARSTGVAAGIKRRLIGLFDAALVGGAPQKRYFASMGFPEDKIFTGYDAVDNDFFARRAGEVRGRAAEVRARYDLPEHYFLSLGRFVAKKNLAALILAYRAFLDLNPDCQTHLVMVGSGEEDSTLRGLCSRLNLPIYDHAPPSVQTSGRRTPGVHFYGFRQIDENPVFYALAKAFVLPSLYEEWGLVVNEAMASGLPVVVSETAGCVEDLLEPGWPLGVNPNSPELLGHLGQIKGCIRKNGFVFDPQSPQALAAVLLALESVPALGPVMGQSSRQIIEKFSCRVFAERALDAMRAARHVQGLRN
jgi:glycosyltransferase involved in cell wall biosynthesis